MTKIHELPPTNDGLRLTKGAPGVAYVVDLGTGTIVAKVFLVGGATWSVTAMIDGRERQAQSYTGLPRVLSLLAQMRKGVC